MELAIINQRIYTVRSVKIMLDRDLAELYEVETRVLNQSVKRNKELFPSDFMFQLTKEEYENMSDIKNKTPKFCIAVCIYRAWSCHVIKCLKKFKNLGHFFITEKIIKEWLSKDLINFIEEK